VASRFLSGALRIVRGIPLALLAPIFLVFVAAALALVDLIARLAPRPSFRINTRPGTSAVSIVIPNWNGCDLLQKYLPSVVEAASRFPGSEIIVVDNGSTDGSAAFVRQHFPAIKLLALPNNLGFGGGSNAGIKAAKHDIVVLLNNDMRVEPDFLEPLVAGFTDELVFSVSCQIFFSDPAKVRQETGLTQTWWRQGSVRVRHRDDPAIKGLFPCSYGGGGSCAYDRKKFLELGGFDELLAPFYMEDTDLGYLAWKRGWKTLYQPASIVYHEHRGTIGRRFSDSYIQGVLKKNYLLFAWKNIHDWRMLASHFFFSWASGLVCWIFGDSPERSDLSCIARATSQLHDAIRSRWRALRLASISDREAFRRPLGGHFRDTFEITVDNPDPLRVLFVSPYPICPPTHGGGVFMYQTVRELARLCELHVIVSLDFPHERKSHRELDQLCASTEYFLRRGHKQKALGTLEPHAVREFRMPDLEWAIHRQIYTHKIDVLQLEYTVLGQYAGQFRNIPSILFEHDIYFQSIARRLPYMTRFLERLKAHWEYLRALRYELKLLPKMDRIQVCSRQNADYLISFLPELKGRVDDGFRAGIEPAKYPFKRDGREPLTMLFLGNFRHVPNHEALDWLLRKVLPLVFTGEPDARLLIVGSEPPAQHTLPRVGSYDAGSIEIVGFVEDVREPLGRYSLFLCPILSGSGVRVKLLEAFACGIPVVSTRLGAEGLTDQDGEICALADEPESFAQHVIRLLRNPQEAAEMAERAREYVMRERDIAVMTANLAECYKTEVRRMRASRVAAVQTARAICP
jgi:GT2 family glycosyltransferase/glycosyltransferase involved in cell wall biosynthesis